MNKLNSILFFCFLFMSSLKVLLFLFLAQTTQKEHCGVQNCETAPVLSITVSIL